MDDEARVYDSWSVRYGLWVVVGLAGDKSGEEGFSLNES